MEVVVETWRVKKEKGKIPAPPSTPPQTAKCPASLKCLEAKIETDQPKKKEKNKKKDKNQIPKEPSLATLSKSAKDNCCSCCTHMAEYIKDAAKMFCCLLKGSKPETRLTESMCGFVGSSGAFCCDICSIIKKIYCCLTP